MKRLTIVVLGWGSKEALCVCVCVCVGGGGMRLCTIRPVTGAHVHATYRVWDDMNIDLATRVVSPVSEKIR